MTIMQITSSLQICDLISFLSREEEALGLNTVHCFINNYWEFKYRPGPVPGTIHICPQEA